MWAKETVLADNRRLLRDIQAMQRENRELRAYIRGLENGIRQGRRVRICDQGGKE